LAYPSSTIVGLLQNTNLLQRLTDFSLDGGRGVGVV
jgi:hypothetical protein